MPCSKHLKPIIEGERMLLEGALIYYARRGEVRPKLQTKLLYREESKKVKKNCMRTKSMLAKLFLMKYRIFFNSHNFVLVPGTKNPMENPLSKQPNARTDIA